MNRLLISLFIIHCSLFTIAGCAKNSQGRLAVEGMVTLDGEPVAEGTISFEPVGSQTLKTRSAAQIRSGKYAMPAGGGIVAGEYAVQIAAEKKTGKMLQTPLGEAAETIDIVPPEYGAASTQRITVAEGGKQTFDFPMKTK